jgi:hypothetical protein
MQGPTQYNVLFDSAVRSPLTTLGNSTTREEHADSKWKKVTVQEWKNSFTNSTKGVVHA